jgi:5'-nucleotidase
MVFGFYRLLSSTVLILFMGFLVLTGCSGDGGGDGRGEVTLSILYSSDFDGKIRSCGCADRDMGGLGRRATYTREARGGVANLIAVDAGDLFSLDLSFSQREAELTFDALNLMGLDVFTPGEIEFIFGLPFLQQLAERVEFDVIALNLLDSKSGERIFPKPYTLRKTDRGVTVGITGVIDETVRFPGYIDRSGFELVPCEDELQKIMPELAREADFLVLLSHLGLERSIALAERFPQFDVIVIGHAKPIIKTDRKVGNTILVASGSAGQYMGRLDLVLTGDGEYKYGKMRIIPLGDDIEVYEGVADLFRSYGVPLTDKEIGKP